MMNGIKSIESPGLGSATEEGRVVSPSFAGKRLAREWQTIAAMVGCYCEGHHDTKAALCPECQGVLDYAAVRVERGRVRGGEARLRQVPGPLLSARPARTGQGGDALCRSAHVVAASDSEPAPFAGW